MSKEDENSSGVLIGCLYLEAQLAAESTGGEVLAFAATSVLQHVSSSQRSVDM